MSHVGFLYGVCVGITAKIVDQMFEKVKRVVRRIKAYPILDIIVRTGFSEPTLLQAALIR